MTNIRRVITGHRDNKAVFVRDENVPRAHDFVHVPGMSMALIWATSPAPAIASQADPIDAASTFIPPLGETRLFVVTFAPDAVMGAAGFDGAAAGRENAEHCPDIAAKIEPDNPGMHRTDTVDYAIVLSGEVWLELDDGQTKHLKANDVVIQNGTRHAWRNRSAAPVTVAFVMVGASR